MAEIERSASAVWQGDLRNGKGQISAPSGVLQDDAYSFVTRFENSPGTNPEELIAAAHAACFSMAFSGVLGRNGFPPESIRIRTQAFVEMEKQDIGFTVTRIRLETEGQIPNIDEAKFKELAEDAKKNCPISRLLTPGLQSVDLVAKLKK